ncbi:hypothetical protein AB8U03_06610 [Clostridium sp. Mt-5]|uniref:Type IV pilus assembly protein PilM n=1 Tax=Clostridium moutaii TaxID=3240932 RepID=A0ABV4BM67_9CLOT
MSSKIIFSFKENYACAAVVSKTIKGVNIKKVCRIMKKGEAISGGQPYADEYNLNKIKDIREEFKLKNKKISIILNWDSIITRIIETPVMGKKELKSFIDNNIEEYFAVNINEYCFDYEIISLDKKHKMWVMLVVAPMVKIKQVLEFIKCCGLKADSIGIYPEYISNLFLDEFDSSAAVVDVNGNKSTLTILDEEKIFIYSNISSEDYRKDERNFTEVMENLDYFLNFYSTRHFGKNVEKIYMLGEFYDNDVLNGLIESQTSIKPVVGLNPKVSKLIGNSRVDGNIYSDIVGYFVPVKNIYNKSINFINKLHSKNEDKKWTGNRFIINEIEIFCLITIIMITAVLIYTKFSLSKYDTSDLDSQIAVLSSAKEDADKLDIEKKSYEAKVKYIQKIKEDEFDYMDLLETLREGLPEGISITSIKMDRQNIDAQFDVNKRTVDAARLVAALNAMNIFEPVELPEVELNDNVKEVKLNLKLLQSYKGIGAYGEK